MATIDEIEEERIRTLNQIIFLHSCETDELTGPIEVGLTATHDSRPWERCETVATPFQ